MAITPTDDDASSSIVTVRGHAENSSRVNDDTIDNNPTKLGSFNNHQMAHSGLPIPSTSILQTIVEVINPVIIGGGDGYANEIAIGRSADCAYHSLNDVDMSYNTDYYELSLNDKMKNVLQELLGNEKVKLNLSRSLNEDEEPNGNRMDVEHDDDDCTNFRNTTPNEYDDSVVKECDATMSLQAESYFVDDDEDENNSDKTDSNKNNYENTFADRCSGTVADGTVNADVVDADDYCRVYENPNTECRFNDAYVQPPSEKQLSKEDEKLKEKLLSELHVDDVRKSQSDANNSRRQDGDDESLQEVFKPTTAASELSKNRNNGKKNKRKGKNKKK